MHIAVSRAMWGDRSNPNLSLFPITLQAWWGVGGALPKKKKRAKRALIGKAPARDSYHRAKRALFRAFRR